MAFILRWTLLINFFFAFAFAQSSLLLKTRRIETSVKRRVTELNGPSLNGRRHLILQFSQPPSAAITAELRRRGISVLGDVPENGLLVSLERRAMVGDLGIRFAEPIDPSDKVSPLLTGQPAAANGNLLVEFYSDVDLDYARGLMLNLNIELHENPDLGARELMVLAGSDPGFLARLTALDQVAYVYPASDELATGIPVRPCAGALTTNGASSQLIPTYGNGWDGPGLGDATLHYVFSSVTNKLDPSATRAEVLRAMEEWSKVVKVNWTPGNNPTAPSTVNIMFATGDHGDGFPFDGHGGVLAHTFYPAPPNPEPIAGDMHFDDAESWGIGTGVDVFSVALHELGHALGLGHSDNPSAVMYPYYRMVTTLSAADKATILTLYAKQDATAGPPAHPSQPAPAPTPIPVPPVNPPASPVAPPSKPLTLNVNAASPAPGASAINLSGSASGGTGAIVITWTTDRGASGTAQGAPSAWTIAGVQLAGASVAITVTATAGSSRVSQTITVAGPTRTDTTPPVLDIVSPSASTISTSAASIVISGTATDNVGVTAVTWSTNTNKTGTASGTSNWSATIPLLVGSNAVTIRASDAAGNTAWRTVVIARH